MLVHRLVFVLLLALVCGCPRRESAPPAARPEPERIEAAGLHNVWKLSDRLYSGSSPDDDGAFASLQKLGVRTVISVDGAKPDVARARAHGLRYVHVPIGYDGVPRGRALIVARAVRDLPGPVYLHCHHGKHRGPASASVALMCLDESCAAEDAIAWLRAAGTDPRYRGLYAAPRDLRRPTKEEVDAVPAVFPEVAEVGGVAKLMVEIDARWEHLTLSRKVGWKPPPGHPDVDPPHEALQLAELYREAARVKGQGDEVRAWMAEAAVVAGRLEKALRAGEKEATEKAYKAAAADCARCHAKHRDVPR